MRLCVWMIMDTKHIVDELLDTLHKNNCECRGMEWRVIMDILLNLLEISSVTHR